MELGLSLGDASNSSRAKIKGLGLRIAKTDPPPVELGLLPNTRFPWASSDNGGSSEAGSSNRVEEVSSRPCDEDETRKKLRLSKDQSAFLEDTFKQHTTLNPKQKAAVARQLNLRPRQVEVWFQNRRARTKLKQTEVECEYLKRCCETLTEENRRLHEELRALKTCSPLHMQLPATTLTMCPSCQRVATSHPSPRNL